MADADGKAERRDEDELVRWLLARAEELKSRKNVVNSHLDEVQRFIRPIAQKATSGPLGQDQPGTKNRQEILDSSGEGASDILVNAIYGRVMNPATKFFGLKPVDDLLRRDGDVMAWLEMAVKDIAALLQSPDTSFSSHAESWLGELVDFGTSGLYVAERPARAPLIQARPLAELYLAEGQDGRIDTVFRNPSMTARQAVQKFKSGLPAELHAHAEKKPEDLLEFWHCVWPADELPARLAPRGLYGRKPFASFWLSTKGKCIVERNGFEELPYIVPRWQVRAGEVYGRGPGIKALADVKMLQRAMRTQIRGVEKSVDPPNLIADDGIIGPMRINPGSNIYVQPDLMTGTASPVRQMEFTGRLDIGEEFMDRVRARIDARYYKDLLLLPRDPRMPATHILKLEEETATILGPFFGRAQLEGVAPLIWRLFMIRLRAGVYGAPPPQLRGREVQVDYEGMQGKAQRLGEVRAVSQFLDVMVPLANIKPEVMDKFDEDAAADVVADGLALPRRVIRDERKVAQIRQARAEAQRAANETALAAEQAGALQSGAQGAAALAGALKTAGMLPNAEEGARRAA